MVSKKTLIGTSLVALFALSLTGSWAYAQTSNQTALADPGKFQGGEPFHHGKGGKMEKTMSPEVQKLMDDLRTAQQSGDTAKVTELRQQLKDQRDADMAAREAEMDTALKGGYETWKTYVISKGMPEEMIAKITPENFSTLVELHDTQKKERELREKLGMDDMGFHHMGF